VARLHANAKFMKQLEKAKDEFAKLNKDGKVKKSTFVQDHKKAVAQKSAAQ
jgi:acid phosphatase (class A)